MAYSNNTGVSLNKIFKVDFLGSLGKLASTGITVFFLNFLKLTLKNTLKLFFTFMNSYKIITDFCSDLSPELAEKLDVEVIPMEVVLEGEEPRPGNEIDVSEFYAKLRAKKNA